MFHSDFHSCVIKLFSLDDTEHLIEKKKKEKIDLDCNSSEPGLSAPLR